MKLLSGLALVWCCMLAGCLAIPSRDEPVMRVTSATITPGSPYWKYAQRFAGRDPHEDAAAAFGKKRYAIYSANGYALYYPGLDYGLGRLMASRFGKMPLPAFSDMVSGKEHLAYMRLAEQYAAAYNREMRRLLTESGQLKK